jgi:hypothetical protein
MGLMNCSNRSLNYALAMLNAVIAGASLKTFLLGDRLVIALAPIVANGEKN